MSRLAVGSVVIGLLAALLTGCSPATAPPVVLATTTSVANSGLLDVLLREFEQQRGVVIRPHLVGSGRALAMLAAGQVEIVISHAPQAEARALEQHPRWVYEKLMFNDFVIVGPPVDPANVKTAPTAREAFRRIARAGVRFISRGDESGTHER